ncbi:MAG: serine/threonine protein kinase [Planctomycetota bacterium]|nr:MAG: serine/threonine protein kinase [Planctomycetota bacterium]
MSQLHNDTESLLTINQPSTPKSGVRIKPGETDITILERIGSGGFGDIYEIIQHDLGRRSALKVIRTENNSSENSQDFLRESLISAHLDHPNILPVHSLIRMSDGRLGLIMKYIKGETWKALIERNVDKSEWLDYLDANLEVAAKVCEAMAFSHDKGIIHRDIKPANIMIGKFGEVLLMDWGCAAGYDNESDIPGVPHINSCTSLTGTPAYMPPEMATRKADMIAPHSDVFLLGACLFHVTRKKAPFASRSIAEALAKASADKPERICSHPAHWPIPETLNLLIKDCIKGSPWKRVQNMTSLRKRIRHVQSSLSALKILEEQRCKYQSLQDLTLFSDLRLKRLLEIREGLGMALAHDPKNTEIKELLSLVLRDAYISAHQLNKNLIASDLAAHAEKLELTGDHTYLNDTDPILKEDAIDDNIPPESKWFLAIPRAIFPLSSLSLGFIWSLGAQSHQGIMIAAIIAVFWYGLFGLLGIPYRTSSTA